MVKLYLKRIKAGLMTIEEVPFKWRKAVAEQLKEEADE